MKYSKVIEALHTLIDAFEDEERVETIKEEKTLEIPFNVHTTLAERVAKSYQTCHTDRTVNSLYKDIEYMAGREDKVGILVSWVRKNSVDGLSDFFKASKQDQQKFILDAIHNNKELVINILTKRFS